MSLQPTLRIDRHDRRLTFTVTVRNAGTDPAELRFTDAGLLQIVVMAPDGTQLYDSRAGRMFASVMKTIVVAPEACTTFDATWDAPSTVLGVLTVRAVVRSVPPLSATQTITLGG
ncbi:MAG: hypothetical protein NVS3B7_20660 [Candidatus Elarobacter sp.]